MPKLYSSDEIVRALRKCGFDFVSQKGSHAKFKSSAGRTAIIPMSKKEIPYGTFRSILKQSGLTLREFMDFLKQ